MRTGLFGALGCVWFVTGAAPHAEAATPPVPTISRPITGPGPDVSQPAGQRRAGAVQVEDFPYLTEEYFVSGTVNGRALHDAHHRPASERRERVQRHRRGRGAARRRTLADLRVVARVDPDAQPHVRGDRAQPGEHQPAQDVQRRALRVAEHRQGQTNEVIAQVGTTDQEQAPGRSPPYAVQRVDADGHVGVERHGAHVSRRSRRPADARTAVRSSTASC